MRNAEFPPGNRKEGPMPLSIRNQGEARNRVADEAKRRAMHQAEPEGEKAVLADAKFRNATCDNRCQKTVYLEPETQPATIIANAKVLFQAPRKSWANA